MNDLIRQIMAAEYLDGAAELGFMDCWGLVEVWYRERLGITLADRGSIEPGPLGISAGFAARADWVEVGEPRDDDVVIMRARWNGQTIRHGHCGVFWRGSVLHIDRSHGAAYQPFAAPVLAAQVTSLLRHRDLT